MWTGGVEKATKKETAVPVKARDIHPHAPLAKMSSSLHGNDGDGNHDVEGDVIRPPRGPSSAGPDSHSPPFLFWPFQAAGAQL